MSMTDPIGDMLTRIRNGQMARKTTIVSPASKQRERVLDVLEREGFIRGYARTDYDGGKADLQIELKYYEGEPVIQRIKRISTPGRRIYSSVKDLPRVANGLGISILSTPRGVLSDAEARDANVGGEILAEVFQEQAMSRIGKLPVQVPDGVSVQIDGQDIAVKGGKGELNLRLVDEVSAAQEDGAVVVTPRGDSKRARSMWGMQRSLVQNMVTGVSNGFEIDLEIQGVGYRAAVQGQNLNLQLGFSHDVAFPVPDGVTITCERPTMIKVAGIDKQLVGQVAAKIRSYRPPEPYKGKGVRYVGEYIFRKEGKKK